MKPLILAVFAMASLSGCLSRNAAEPIRYFRPEAPREPAATAAGAKAARPDPDQRPDAAALRLRRVSAAAYLKDRIARRTSDVEVSYSDLVRWSEPPVSYVERALTRDLFETRGLTRTDAAGGWRLDVELRAFDETLEPSRAATVAIWALLVEGDTPRFERTFEAHNPVASDDPAALARAMGIALDAAVRDLGRAIDDSIHHAHE